MTSQIIEERELISIDLPLQTQSYQPVSHTELLKEIKTKANDFYKDKPKEQLLRVARGGKKLFGTLTYKTQESETEMMIGFGNSYDKSMSVKLVSGANIMVCSNGMFVGDILRTRKHTRFVWKDVKRNIDEILRKSKENYQIILEDIENFKFIKLSDTDAASLLGILFVEKDLLNSHQMTIAKTEWFRSENFKDKSLWSLYNACTMAFKKSHPNRAMEKYTELHQFMLEHAN